MAGTLSVTPVCSYVYLSYTYILLSVRMSVCRTQRRPLSKSNTFEQNFIKLGHIVAYHNVLYKFDKGPYRIMPSGVIALCS